MIYLYAIARSESPQKLYRAESKGIRSTNVASALFFPVLMFFNALFLVTSLCLKVNSERKRGRGHMGHSSDCCQSLS